VGDAVGIERYADSFGDERGTGDVAGERHLPVVAIDGDGAGGKFFVEGVFCFDHRNDAGIGRGAGDVFARGLGFGANDLSGALKFGANLIGREMPVGQLRGDAVFDFFGFFAGAFAERRRSRFGFIRSFDFSRLRRWRWSRAFFLQVIITKGTGSGSDEEKEESFFHEVVCAVRHERAVLVQCRGKVSG